MCSVRCHSGADAKDTERGNDASACLADGDRQFSNAMFEFLHCGNISGAAVANHQLPHFGCGVCSLGASNTNEIHVFEQRLNFSFLVIP